MAQVLRHLLPVADPKVLSDARARDDAAVYQIGPEHALVVTLDFFTPIVDDPYDFGRIAAVNALSDVYAMGAKPLFALNLLSFPRALLGEGLAEEIIRGGAEKAREAGAVVLGGHSIDDAEPKYGMVVVGEADPSRLLTNDRAREGDDLVLTKPLGTGVVATAIKAGVCPAPLIASAVKSMVQLNREASEAALKARAHAATDITGFGLTGHLGNLAEASRVAIRIEAGRVPVLEGAVDLVEEGFVPGGTKRNLADSESRVTYESELPQAAKVILADAQTSGGLAIAVPPQKTNMLLEELEARSVKAAVIGQVVAGQPGHIIIS